MGVAALLVVLVGDLPDLHRAGALGEVYAGSDAGPRRRLVRRVGRGASRCWWRAACCWGWAPARAPLREPAAGTAAGR